MFFYFYLVEIKILFPILFFTFSLDNIILFYIFFEVSLIPIFYILLNYGYGSERLIATYYIIRYTIFGRVPFLFYILELFYKKIYFFSFSIFLNNSFIIFFYSIIFLIKIPVFLIHSWLLKAHVESPTKGRILLARLLLKIGSYGLVRVFSICIYYWNILFILGIFGSFLSAIFTLLCSDIKTIIAISRVVHISLSILACLSFKPESIVSLTLLSISHGFTSGSLFYLFGVLYIKIKSRSCLLLKGFNNSLGLIWFIFCVINSGTPPFIGFWGELTIYIIFFSIFYFPVIILCVIFFIGVYNIIIFSTIFHGKGVLYNIYKTDILFSIFFIYLRLILYVYFLL